MQSCRSFSAPTLLDVLLLILYLSRQISEIQISGIMAVKIKTQTTHNNITIKKYNGPYKRVQTCEKYTTTDH